MESTTTLHHQLQQQRLQEQLLSIQSSSSGIPISSSSSSTSSSSTSSSSSYALATPPPSWSSSNHFVLNSGSSYVPSTDGSAVLNSRDDHPPMMNSNNMQDLNFHWAIKDELSSNQVYPKFTDMINGSPSSSIEDLQLQSNFSDHHMMMNEKVLLRNFSSGCQIDGLQPDFYSDVIHNSSAPSRVGTFSQIFPSVNISSSFSQSGMSLEALDLFNSTAAGRFHNNGTNFSQTANLHDHLLAAATTAPDYLSRDNIRSTSPNKRASFNSVEAKRRSSFMEPSKAPQAAPKKSRLDSRSSCPPFKVRKEKLGDRIAALQQLVAPFGKTDTASVLMEAIGYIKFLQNQVETLSVPYMKSSGNKTSRRMQEQVSGDDDEVEGRRDLRSRGLCLVPLSCLSYVTDAGGGVWAPVPPDHFGTST